MRQIADPNDTVTVGTDTLTFEGTNNEIETAVSNNKITIGLPNTVAVVIDFSVGGDATVTGNLTNGTLTISNTQVLTTDDAIIGLQDSLGSNPNNNDLA